MNRNRLPGSRTGVSTCQQDVGIELPEITYCSERRERIRRAPRRYLDDIAGLVEMQLALPLSFLLTVPVSIL
jgi:hypothetical protein